METLCNFDLKYNINKNIIYIYCYHSDTESCVMTASHSWCEIIIMNV